MFDRLIWAGLLTVADGDPVWELRPLDLTDAGAAWYAVLSKRQRDSRQAPAPEHATPSPSPRLAAGPAVDRWPLTVASRTPS